MPLPLQELIPFQRPEPVAFKPKIAPQLLGALAPTGVQRPKPRIEAFEFLDKIKGHEGANIPPPPDPVKGDMSYASGISAGGSFKPLTPPPAPKFMVQSPTARSYSGTLQGIQRIGEEKTLTAQVKAENRLKRINQVAENFGGASAEGWNLGPLAQGQANSIGARAVALARGAIGTPYVWGGNSLTQGIDCSGLIQQVYRRLGINLPRVSVQQARAGRLVGWGGNYGRAMPGDIIVMDSLRRSGMVANGHVAIYAGNGWIIEAPRPGGRVQLVPIGRRYVKSVVRPY